MLNLLIIQADSLFLKINQQIKTKDIKISNNKEYTCIKLSNEKIIVYSNQLGYPIASFDLEYFHSEDSKYAEKKDQKKDKEYFKRKQEKLIKRLYNLMINHPSLICPLFSLLDNNCLNKLIESSPNLQNQLNENPEPESNYSGPHNYIFVHHNHHLIKVNELILEKKWDANYYEREHLKFSDISNLNRCFRKLSIGQRFYYLEI